MFSKSKLNNTYLMVVLISPSVVLEMPISLNLDILHKEINLAKWISSNEQYDRILKNGLCKTLFLFVFSSLATKLATSIRLYKIQKISAQRSCQHQPRNGQKWALIYIPFVYSQWYITLSHIKRLCCATYSRSLSSFVSGSAHGEQGPAKLPPMWWYVLVTS